MRGRGLAVPSVLHEERAHLIENPNLGPSPRQLGETLAHRLAECRGVASAVGEGAMAVAFVHRYLAQG